MIRPARTIASSHRNLVIIGAGPAGSMAAITAARAGLDVLLIDKRTFPRPKVCGCCVNAAALDLLKPTGVLESLSQLNPPLLHHIELRAPGRRATLSLPGGMAISREALDTALVDAAVGAGATFLPGVRGTVGAAQPRHRLVELDDGSYRTEVAAMLVIAADGLAGRAADQSSICDAHSRMGLSCIVEDVPPSFVPGVIHMAWSRHGYVGLVRLETGQLDVAAAMDPCFIRSCGGAAAGICSIVHECGLPVPPELADGSARITGTPLLTRRPADVAGPRLMLAGDAAGYVEPFTGEGIGWALASGRAAAAIAADCIDAGQPEQAAHRWRRVHAELLAWRHRDCLALTKLLRRPLFARITGAVLQHFPAAAGPFVRRVNMPFTLDPLLAHR